MSELRGLADLMAVERECERLVFAYARLVDLGEADRAADLFTPDGVWESGDMRIEGRAQLRDRLAARRHNRALVSRQVCTNVIVNLIEPGWAEGTTYFTTYLVDGHEGDGPAPLDGPAVVGHFDDKFVLTTDGWRFAERRVTLAFRRPLSADLMT